MTLGERGGKEGREDLHTPRNMYARSKRLFCLPCHNWTEIIQFWWKQQEGKEGVVNIKVASDLDLLQEGAVV